MKDIVRKEVLSMTKNQIEYAKLLETRRSNIRQEQLTGERDKASRELGRAQLIEAGRHNLAQEGISSVSLDETSRHNVAMENVSVGQLAESTRHNRAGEGISWAQAQEQARHNVANEGLERQAVGVSLLQAEEAQRSNLANEAIRRAQNRETRRSNMANERIKYEQNTIAATNADTNRMNAQVNVANAELLANKYTYDEFASLAGGIGDLVKAGRSIITLPSTLGG
jgi:hypothetical protein